MQKRVLLNGKKMNSDGDIWDGEFVYNRHFRGMTLTNGTLVFGTKKLNNKYRGQMRKGRFTMVKDPYRHLWKCLLKEGSITLRNGDFCLCKEKSLNLFIPVCFTCNCRFSPLLANHKTKIAKWRCLGRFFCGK